MMFDITPKRYDWFVYPGIATLIVLGFTVAMNWPDAIEEVRWEQDIVKMEGYLDFMDTFHERMSPQPREEWFQKGEDAWGNPFWFFYTAQGTMTMVATGQDGWFDTTDDRNHVRILDGETGS